VGRLLLGGSRPMVRMLSVLASNLMAFDAPTLGVVVEMVFYLVGNRLWSRFVRQTRLPPPEQLRRPLILRIRLGEDEPGRRSPKPQPQPQPAPLPCIPPLC
jgi:hypothetical protein